MRASLALAFSLALVLAAPAGEAQTAPIEGEAADIEAFVGEWVGGYECVETGRHGTIVFRLEAGADSLTAAILMVPRATDTELVPASIPLAVHHVAVVGRSFRGSLKPYRDPELDLPLDTEFGGMLDRPDHIEGYFRAHGSQVDTVPQCGRWWATRASDPSARRSP